MRRGSSARASARRGEYRIRNANKTLEVAALDLSVDLKDELERVGEIAKRIRVLKVEAKAARRAAPNPALSR